jgi:dihydrofolate reductase
MPGPLFYYSRSKRGAVPNRERVAMRRIRYAVAASLDGYIAGPKGEADWIVMDPDIDFDAYFEQFDTFLLGRRTFEGMGGTGGSMPGMKTFVFSSTLRPADYPKLTIVADKATETVAALKAEPGKDIWLFGGGLLFRSLAEAGLVDTIEVAVVPVLLGGGTPLFPSPARQTKLELTGHRIYEKTGIVSLEYAVVGGSGGARKRKPAAGRAKQK